MKILLSQAVAVILLSGLAYSAPVLVTKKDGLKEAKELYKKALNLIKSKDRKEGYKVIEYLKESRDQFLAKEELSEENEVTLGKISSLLYWQHKFSRIDRKSRRPAPSVPPKVQIVKVGKENPTQKVNLAETKDSKWSKFIHEKQEVFDTKIEKANSYAQKHEKDYYNNLLNYHQLQEYAHDKKTSHQIAEKTLYFEDKHIKDQKQTLKEALKTVKNYAKLMDQKKYEVLTVKISQILRHSKLTAKGKLTMLQLYQELRAMRAIVVLLKQTPVSGIPLEGLGLLEGSGEQGTILEINEKGLILQMEDSNIQSSISWEVASEQSILKIANYVIKDESKEDLFILAIANLRLENFRRSFSYFRKLIDKDPKNILRYRSYLERCEIGQRKKVGTYIDLELEKAISLSSKGNKQQAIKNLGILMRDYINEPLNKVFLTRYYTAYASVLRN